MKVEDEAQSGTVFQEYAGFYDTLYQDKNYAAECDFLQAIFNRYSSKPVKHILDLGCGTGGHVISLVKRNYQVVGVDRSAQMIKNAEQKSSALPPDRVHYVCDTIQHFNAGYTFDSVISMFAVLSYQIMNEEFMQTLQTVRRHLSNGGLFICDIWYGPAVLSERPNERVKIVKHGTQRIIRLAKPTLDVNCNTVTVSYHLLQLEDNILKSENHENHLMRYFFMPELKYYFSQTGLEIVHACPFMQIDEPINATTWNISLIAAAK